MDEDSVTTIQRDLAAIAAQIEVAKEKAKEKDPQGAWYHLDLAEARVQQLTGFIGLSHPWDEGMMDQARQHARRSILPK